MSIGKLEALTEQLLQTWCRALIKYQVKDIKSTGLKGGLLSPAYARIEGRCAEAVYPFLYLADKNNDSDYLEASIQLINWAENNVIFADGSWVNEVSVSDWRGVTVNAVVAMEEALLWHGHLLERKEHERWINLTGRSADYIFRTIDLGYGNINYTIVNSYAMALVGKLFDNKKYRLRADELAHKVLPFLPKKISCCLAKVNPMTLKVRKDVMLSIWDIMLRSRCLPLHFTDY
jgi:hypothetical protein